MNKHNLIFILILLVALFLGLQIVNTDSKPIKLQASGALPEMTIDDKIYASDLIIIGEVSKVLPSRWNTSRAILANELTSKEIIQTGLGIFTDSLLIDKLVLKGEIPSASTLHVRSFMGTIENISIISSSEPSYEEGETYLLFLQKDNGPTQSVDSGDYIAVNAINGVYEIVGDKAISDDSEWILDDLITYIQLSPLSVPMINIMETQDAQEIIRTIELAYDIETKAAYDFNTKNFLSVFRNDPSIETNPDKLEFVRNFASDSSPELLGYLNYKLAYYNWWQESSLQFDALNEKAKLENREVTQDELKSVIDSEWSEKWGLAPARAESPERKVSLKFISVNVINDIAVVYLHDGFQVVILYVNKFDGQWYIVGDKENSLIQTP